MSKNLLVFPFPYCFINLSTNLPNAIVLNLINSKNDLSVFNKLIRDTIAENIYDYIIIISVSKTMTDFEEEGVNMIKILPSPRNFHNTLDKSYKDDSIQDNIYVIRDLYRVKVNGNSVPVELDNDETIDDLLDGFTIKFSEDESYLLSKNKQGFCIALDSELDIKICGSYVNGNAHFNHVITNTPCGKAFQAFHGLVNSEENKHWIDLKKFMESKEVADFLK